MKKILILAGALSLGLAACASTDGTSTTASSGSTAKQAKAEIGPGPDQLRCVSRAVTGSKFKKKICRTNAEWEAIRQAAQQNTGDAQRRGTNSNSGN